jgi:hypothetical protein
VEFDWNKHIWLIVVLAVFAVPLVQAFFAPWSRYLRYRERREAIEALKVYAAQGREPPAEVLNALGGRWGRWRAAAEDVADAATFAGGDKQARRDARRQYRFEMRRYRAPLRNWNGAIFCGAIAAGFGFAWEYGHHHNDAFLIVAIIAGALTVAGVLTALLSTFWRID